MFSIDNLADAASVAGAPALVRGAVLLETYYFALVAVLALFPFVLWPLAYLSRYVNFNVDWLADLMGGAVGMSAFGAMAAILLIPAVGGALYWYSDSTETMMQFLRIGFIRYVPVFIAVMAEVYVGLLSDATGWVPLPFGVLMVGYAWWLRKCDSEAARA